MVLCSKNTQPTKYVTVSHIYVHPYDCCHNKDFNDINLYLRSLAMVTEPVAWLAHVEPTSKALYSLLPRHPDGIPSNSVSSTSGLAF